jgi:hypothetical protein
MWSMTALIGAKPVPDAKNVIGELAAWQVANVQL